MYKTITQNIYFKKCKHKFKFVNVSKSKNLISLQKIVAVVDSDLRIR